MPDAAVRPAISTGTCAFCQVTFPKNTMARHLTHCPARKNAIAAANAGGGEAQQVFHLLVEGKHNAVYWLHLEAPGGASFVTLDQFLRDIWLECCGHMSEFSIRTPGLRGTRGGTEEIDMSTRLDRVLTKDLKIDHAYDFGSTTHLTLRMVGSREGHPLDPDVFVMARNRAPEILCSVCVKPATQISTEWYGKAFCDKCATKKDEDYLLPVVNSPRTGVCAYTGED